MVLNKKQSEPVYYVFPDGEGAPGRCLERWRRKKGGGETGTGRGIVNEITKKNKGKNVGW